MIISSILIPLCLLASSMAAVSTEKAHKTRILALETPQFKVLKRYERKGDLYYTQGLLFKDAHTLIESAGLYGQSGLQLVQLEDSLPVQKSHKLSSEFFAEGCTEITASDGSKEIYQLTWRERKIFVYDSETLTLKRSLELPRPIQEGWGLTHRLENGKYKLYVTDGSSKVYVLDPEALRVERTIEVTENGSAVTFLNELEFLGDTLLANVYLTNKIVALDVDSGKVKRNIDCSALVSEVQGTKTFRDNNLDYSDCLNGIAYHKPTDTLLVTGKKWPYIYQLEIKENL